jgi:hypothetical protein
MAGVIRVPLVNRVIRRPLCLAWVLFIAGRQIVVTVHAFIVASLGEFDGPPDGHPLVGEPLVYFQAPIAVCLVFHDLNLINFVNHPLRSIHRVHREGLFFHYR